MAKPKVFVTRSIPQNGITLLQKEFEVRVHPHPHKISPAELKRGVLWCDALLSLLTDKITSEVLDLNPRNTIADLSNIQNDVEVKTVKQKEGEHNVLVVRVQHICGYGAPSKIQYQQNH